MIHPARICIIIPAYNEGRILPALLHKLLQSGYQIVVVDDGSTDDTEQLLASFPIYYLRHRVNLGQGAALETGMRFAQRLDADIFVHFDADGQHDVAEIERLAKPVSEEKADIVLGSRFLDAETKSAVPISKRVLLKGAIWINGLFTGLWLSDAHNGFRAMNRKALEQIRLREAGMAHATEILSEIKRHGLRYQEVPVHIRYSEYAREKGQSIWNSISILTDLIVRKIFPL
ncbi:MAG: glycosyltransferase family 2 protein [Bacteroidota bacterium]